MQLGHQLGLLHRTQVNLAAALREVSEAHADEVDVFHMARRLADECDAHATRLEPFAKRYREAADDAPDRLHAELFSGSRGGPLGLLRDLQDLYLMANLCDVAWMLVGQAAQGIRDTELFAVVQTCEGETAGQVAWLRARLKEAAPQALVVA
jgi:hypothetical protein